MIISGLEIKRLMTGSKPRIVIEPFNEDQLNPNSYNVRLFNKLLEVLPNNNGKIDPKLEMVTKEITIPLEGFTLEPGKLYLGSTVEYTETYQHVPMLDGRSSWGRIGVLIHATAGFGDVGFKGHWTLEITCTLPTVIYPNVEIGQVFYHHTNSNHKTYVSSKYQDQKNGPVPSRLHLELNKKGG